MKQVLVKDIIKTNTCGIYCYQRGSEISIKSSRHTERLIAFLEFIACFIT